MATKHVTVINKILNCCVFEYPDLATNISLKHNKQILLGNGLYLFPLSEFDIDHTDTIAGKSQNLPALLIIWVFCQVTVTQEHISTGYHRETLKYLAYTIPEKMATSRFHIPTAKPASSLADKVQCTGSPHFCDPEFLWNTVCLIANIQYISGSGATWEDSFSLKEKRNTSMISPATLGHHLTMELFPLFKPTAVHQGACQEIAGIQQQLEVVCRVHGTFCMHLSKC